MFEPNVKLLIKLIVYLIKTELQVKQKSKRIGLKLAAQYYGLKFVLWRVK